MMIAARPFIERDIHPSIITQGYYRALEDALKIMEELAIKIDINKDEEICKALNSCVGTKFASRWGSLISDLSIKATRIIMREGNMN
jgi:T-complex protein 1 subunit gamma